MASTILVRDALWRVSSALSDGSPQFSRWPERYLVHLLNDAQSVIGSLVTTACSRLVAIKLKAGTKQSIANVAAADWKLDGVAGAAPLLGRRLLGVWRNMGTDGATPGRAIRAVERDVLDALDPNWHTSRQTKVYEYAYNEDTPTVFFAVPGAHAETPVWVEASLVVAPALIPAGGAPGAEIYLASGASAAVIAIDDEHIQELVDYVCARAHLSDSKYAEPLRAQLHTNLFLSLINAKATIATGTNPNLTALPGVSKPGSRT